MVPRSFWLPLVLVALAYAALCALMYVRQRSLVYFPQQTRVATARTDFALQRDGIALRGWVVNPGKPAALVYFGGNGERIEDNRDDFARWFPERSVYLVAYRGYGASDGEPGQQALLSDALAVFDHVAAAHPEAPVAVIGRSLGSGVASYVASRRPVERLALITPFDSLASVAQAHYPWLPVRWLLTERYPSVDYLHAYTGPLLIVRAGADEVVPAANTGRLIAALPRPPQVVTIPGAGHNDLGADPRYGRALARFIPPQAAAWPDPGSGIAATASGSPPDNAGSPTPPRN